MSSAIRRLGVPVVGALLLAAVLAGLYPSFAERAGDPLAVFLLPALFVALVSDEFRTALVAAASSAVAAVEGLATDLGDAQFAARMGVIVLGCVAAVVGARVRADRERKLRRAAVSDALATAFQEGLVPRPVPPPGLSATVRYRPATLPLMLGGDFLDVITLPDGAAGFVIGDVTGHGPRAAAFGPRVRAGWKSVAHTMPTQPGRWFEEVEAAFLRDGRFDGFVTGITGRVDESGVLSIVCAGHPRPVLIADDVAAFLQLGVGTPMGVPRPTPRPVTTSRLEPGHSLLLYTDGILENRRTPGGRAGERSLLRAVGAMSAAVDLDALLEEFGPNGYDDDVALMLLERSGSGAPRTDESEAVPAPASLGMPSAN